MTLKAFLKINVRKTKRLLCGTDSPPSQSKNTISRALDMLQIFCQIYDKFLLAGDETELNLPEFLSNYNAKIYQKLTLFSKEMY